MKVLLKWTLRILTVTIVAAVALTVVVVWWSSRDTTVYASGFTNAAFERVELGMELADVYSLLGQPLGIREEDSPERWCYGEAPIVREGSTYVVEDFFRESRCISFNEAGLVFRANGDGMEAVERGMTTEEVLQILGEPDRREPAAAMTLHYSQPGGEGLFRARIVAVSASGRVNDVIDYEFYD